MVEGSLHRALASYVHRRASQNSSARLVARVMVTFCWHISAVISCRPGRERMQSLKEIATKTKEARARGVQHLN